MNKKFNLVLLLISFGFSATAQSFFSTKKGAIDGYDPVAYFIEQIPLEGKENIKYEWGGEIWYFSSVQNKEWFEQDPEKYVPQYGGFCAYAVANGYTAKIDPLAWKIVNGRLYLNYSKSVQKKWEHNRESFIRQADENWPKIKVN